MCKWLNCFITAKQERKDTKLKSCQGSNKNGLKDTTKLLSIDKGKLILTRNIYILLTKRKDCSKTVHHISKYCELLVNNTHNVYLLLVRILLFLQEQSLPCMS